LSPGKQNEKFNSFSFERFILEKVKDIKMLLSKVQNVVKLVKKEGVLYTFKLTYFVLKSRLKKPFFTNLFMGKSGLEVGGPSSIFDKKGEIPIYQHLKNL
jgi:hypothetical protein